MFIKDIENVNKDFIDYDSEFENGGHYQDLPENGKVLVLLFIQKGQVFTTMRRFTMDKMKHYYSLRSEWFKLIIENEENGSTDKSTGESDTTS